MTTSNNRTDQAHPEHSLGRCTVCTKQIRAGEDHVKVFHGGASYLVCCASCAAKFEARPQQYLVS